MIAKFGLDRAQAMLNRRTIKSPVAGVVVEQFVSPEAFVDNQHLLKSCTAQSPACGSCLSRRNVLK